MVKAVDQRPILPSHRSIIRGGMDWIRAWKDWEALGRYWRLRQAHTDGSWPKDSLRHVVNVVVGISPYRLETRTSRDIHIACHWIPSAE